MNESKIRSPKMWESWKKSGALGGMDDARLQSVRESGPIKIEAITEHFLGPAGGRSVLSLGEIVVAEGFGLNGSWRVTKPVIAVVVPGHEYKLHEVIIIPKKAKPLNRFFSQS